MTAIAFLCDCAMGGLKFATSGLAFTKGELCNINSKGRAHDCKVLLRVSTLQGNAAKSIKSCEFAAFYSTILPRLHAVSLYRRFSVHEKIFQLVHRFDCRCEPAGPPPTSPCFAWILRITIFRSNSAAAHRNPTVPFD
jgi:hypothetical protein